MFLTREQIEQLTGRSTPSGQARALNKMGITHKRRADGQVVVLSSHIEKQLDGAPTGGKNTRSTPNWSSMA